ncbi:MAG: ABC transporter substrate-binding protein, partial [Spirochaetia bacterium]
NKSDAVYYVNAYQDDFYSYPIFQNYLRIPGTPEMQEVWDVHLTEAITGQVSAKQALDRTAADWKRIIADIGKDQELKLYQESIGFKP